MPLPFSRALDLKLIELVKANPILYNSTHPKHLDFDEREVVWQKIGDALNRPAVEFAGIQCQIHYGDFQEDKHKPGLIENLSEYLPEQYSSSWGIEKKILKEFRKHQGLGQIEAKFLYTKTARDLPTYGVTFFVVKEKQKGKKKLVPRLLGINAESILRLDEVTKEILQVWPLTQVKTYHAGMAETFTLNFGDYSDKEYSVKTNDAHRIRDILQGYIDIIRKRMEANYNLNMTEHHAICEDNVQASRGHIMQRIEHQPSKMVEESFVGPNQIFTYEPGKSMVQGTQIVTAQQLVISAKAGSQQVAATGEVPMRKDKVALENETKMALDFRRKLHRFNSNAVKIVTLLSDPKNADLTEAIRIVDSMEADMPILVEGIQRAAEAETDEKAKKKLLLEAQELSDLMKTLSDNLVKNNTATAIDTSKYIADLSILLCCTLDPDMMGQSTWCEKSRASLIRSEKKECRWRRESCLAAAHATIQTIQATKTYLDHDYYGPPLDAARVGELERSVADKMGKLNAAVALNLTAYADPKNIDYGAAVTSMNTINELLPELCKDVKALSSVKDGTNREELLNAVRALCDAISKVCTSADPDDHALMETVAKDYGLASKKLLFTFRRPGVVDNDEKQNEILAASNDVIEKTNLLVDQSKHLASLVTEPEAFMLNEAADHCTTAARDVGICAELTAPSIHEPHCRSALKASAENLSSSVQHLLLTWKPMVENHQPMIEILKNNTLELGMALDRLKDLLAGFDATEDPDDVIANRKLKFIATTAEAKKKISEAEAELDKPVTELTSKATEQELRERLFRRVAALNAALGALVNAAADRDKPDYETAELAVSTVADILPDIVKDGKELSARSDGASRDQLLQDLRTLSDAVAALCHSTEEGNFNDINSGASKLAKCCGKLRFTLNPHGKRDSEHIVTNISASVVDQSAKLQATVQELLEQTGPVTDLETASRRLANATQALDIATQLTAPNIQEARCQESLISAADGVSSANQQLSSVCLPLLNDPHYKQIANKFETQRLLLEEELERLRKACRSIGADDGSKADDQKSKEVIRLQFKRASDHLSALNKVLDKPTIPLKSSVPVEDLRSKLADEVNALNAALAALVAAANDRENSDTEATERAIDTINRLLPQVITDTKTLTSKEDEASRAAALADLRAMFDSIQEVFNASQDNIQDLNRAAVKFGAASGRLVYVFDPRADQDREHTILDLSSSACEKASALLSGVYQLATEVGGRGGTDLDHAGGNVADGANTLLTTAQLTSSCIQDPSCRSILLSSTDVLQNASSKLASVWTPIVRDPKYSVLGTTLKDHHDQLEKELEELRRACRLPDRGLIPTKTGRTTAVSPANEKQRQQFLSAAKSAGDNLRLLEDEVNKPLPPAGASPTNIHHKLAQSLAQLNAAIAALLLANTDRDSPDFVKAEQSMKEINQIMPEVVKEIRLVAASADPQTRDLMLSDLRVAIAAVGELCNNPMGPYPQGQMGLGGQAAIVANTCGKLYFAASPRSDQAKDNEIMELTVAACEQATILQSELFQVANTLQGVESSKLEDAGNRIADAADDLMVTARLTAPSIHETPSRSALLSSIDNSSSIVTTLSSTWKPVVKGNKKAEARLVEDKELLDRALERLKEAVIEDRGVKSPVRKAPPPPPPKRISSVVLPAPSLADVTAHFLNCVRDDEARDAHASMKQKKRAEEKAMQQKLRNTVDESVAKVQQAGETLTKLYSSDSEVIPTLSVDQTLVVQKQLEYKLAAASAAAAKLVAAQHLNELDYSAALVPAAALADVMPHIVQDAKLLRGALDEDERKSFSEDVLAMFDAARVLLGAAKNDPRNINESAVVVGNKLAKLLYVVSTDVEPSQEKEILHQARAIGDMASRLAVVAAEKGTDDQFADLCARGGACADAAGTALYTAKLVAPCIQVPECQQALLNTTEELSQQVQQYSHAWADTHTDTQELHSDSTKLLQMLDAFKEDIKSGRLIRRRAFERIAVHDTPLRQLACAIMEDAQKRANRTSESPQRASYVAYAASLGRAIRTLDTAYSHSTNAPHDWNKRQHLENAVQELQVAVLMQRPSAHDNNSNIVDLTNYVQAVNEDAEKLYKDCKGLPELQMVKEHCERIKEYAARAMNPELYEQSPGDMQEDRRDVAEFAEECSKRMKTINSIVQSLEDGKIKIDLIEKAARLSESTNLLKFATKCDLATTQSVSLDATLEELTDLEKRIDDMLVDGGKRRVKTAFRPTNCDRLVVASSRASAGVTGSLVPSFTAYLDDVRVAGDLTDPVYKQKSKDHLLKILKLLKTLTMTSGRHVATWQPPDQPESAAITEEIIKELESYDSSSVDGRQNSVLGDVDISKLLLPTQTKIQLDPKQVPEKLNQALSKLSCAVGTLVQSGTKPASLARSVAAVHEAAVAVAAIATQAPVKDIAHSQQIEGASKEMSIQTYNLLKSAEVMSQDPNNYSSRRKFLDACDRLNDAISMLVRIAGPYDKLHNECSVAIHRSQQRGANVNAGWTCSLGYPHALTELANQRDVLQRLEEEAPMSREELSRGVARAAAAARRCAHYAAHVAYLLSISERHSSLATAGFIDSGRIQTVSEAVQETCHRTVMADADQAKEEAPILIKQVQDFQQAIAEAQDKIKEDKDKKEIEESNKELEEAITELNAVVHESTLNRARFISKIIRILDATRSIGYVIERVSIAPEIKEVSVEAKARSDDVLKHCRNLNTKTLALIREVKASEDQDPMTWVTFGTRKAVLEMFEALVSSIQENGKRAGILEPSQSDLDEELQTKRSFAQVQLDLANKWLSRPANKPEIKTSGEQAARTIISLGEKICEDLKGQEKEEIQDLVTSSEELLAECLKKHDPEKAHQLLERLKALRKAIERCLVSRIVDDFLEGEEPLADLDILADAQTDEEKRKYMLERKIAELLAHLGRVTKTARVAARAGLAPDHVNDQLVTCSEQTELLAPMLVQAAQKRVASPDDQAAIEHYQRLLAEYAASLANLRSLCDQAVDPMDFVQTAGETMQRLREDTTNDNDPQKCAYASTAITKLANRVITVSMSSSDVRKDPELQKALKEAKERLKAVVPGPNARPSRIPDWKITTAEILRTTGEVESVLGGEMIFKKQQTSDEPIFAAALDLHTAIRSWSAKDNEIVAVAKRMAVLMAKLSDYMHTDRKRDVIVTAKAIVSESREVAALARQLAGECSDVRIKTNLLQICERIPTISGQLKMLATVKGSLGHQGLKEDQEDMNMLVGNAQNLMLSVQEAVNAAASASVKIMSQRGGTRMRWVRKSYY